MQVQVQVQVQVEHLHGALLAVVGVADAGPSADDAPGGEGWVEGNPGRGVTHLPW